ncbi:unnamed protein product [Mycena citricolor]|uniref:Ketoreductase domain-containing protein n=2 Tax=Mycena citricolor TaxID=2018698 RepID=A0AAD2HQ08_9AGAR|nr:unnamed protein product [Mycena citricolor]
MSNTKRVVLVTGCSEGGIGYALCERFAAEGCRVYATARRQDAMAGLDQHPLISTHTLDIGIEEDVRRVVDQVVEEQGQIDIVVNNAGVMGIGPLIEQPIDYVKNVFDTNVYGALRVSQAAFSHMADRKSGLIINIGSVVGDIPVPWNGLYSASKAALHSMSEILMMELRPFNIQVMNITPAAVRSNISKNQRSIFRLPESSYFTAYLPSILRRMNSSQSPDAMPEDTFARKVVSAALKSQPPTHLTLGGGAFTFQVLRWLPRSLVFWILWRRFSKTT